MKWKNYIKDKRYFLVFSILSVFFILLILFAFKVDTYLLISIPAIFLTTQMILFLIDYFRKKNFYTNLLSNIEHLDKAYLVLETLHKPEFYEGKLLYQALYEINKSFCEFVTNKEEQITDFKEYIEMWIHEVKMPLASLILTLNNRKNGLDSKTKNILKRLEDNVEEVLYYVRSENAEKDYCIKEVNLSNIIKNVGIRNMDDLLDNKIDFQVNHANYNVYTDSKWLEFILNQIINNSIKYKKKRKHSYIKIEVFEKEETTTLIVEDNGIGIATSDIKQVFDKTFTGMNGRERNTSTGMGLFIAKNLCHKLGHKITIASKENEFTRVSITFAKNKFYDNLTKK